MEQICEVIEYCVPKNNQKITSGMHIEVLSMEDLTITFQTINLGRKQAGLISLSSRYILLDSDDIAAELKD